MSMSRLIAFDWRLARVDFYREYLCDSAPGEAIAISNADGELISDSSCGASNNVDFYIVYFCINVRSSPKAFGFVRAGVFGSFIDLESCFNDIDWPSYGYGVAS